MGDLKARVPRKAFISGLRDFARNPRRGLFMHPALNIQAGMCQSC